MKKKTILDNCLYSFDNKRHWNSLTEAERSDYLKENGYAVAMQTSESTSANPKFYEHSCIWARNFSMPSAAEINDNYWNSKCQPDDIDKYFSDRDIYGNSSSHGVSIDVYNLFAKNDIWEGAYVDGIGFVDAPNSSDLGCSLFLNGSWEPRGTANNPVSVCDFYERKEDGLWPGAYVDTWGYVGTEMSVLGCSASFETANYEMNQAASLTNAMRVLGDATSHDNFYAELRKFWDSDLNCVAMTLLDMENILRREFNVINENVKVALAKHDCVYVRQLKKLYERNGYDYYSSYDVVLIGYDYALNAYGYIDPVTSKVSYMPVERLSDVDVCTYVFSRS